MSKIDLTHPYEPERINIKGATGALKVKRASHGPTLIQKIKRNRSMVTMKDDSKIQNKVQDSKVYRDGACSTNVSVSP